MKINGLIVVLNSQEWLGSTIWFTGHESIFNQKMELSLVKSVHVFGR